MWVLILLSAITAFLPGALLNRTCKEHDVVEYLNISERGPLLTMTMPKKDWTKPMTVIVDNQFIAVLSLVEKAQTMTTYFWIFVEWKNEFISWNPDDFCGISIITLPLSLFWVPDLFYHEQVVEDTSPWIMYVNVTSDGMIRAAKPTRLTSTCLLDIYYFPFDVQECKVTFTSFMYPMSRMVLKTLTNSSEQREKNMNLFLDTGEWHVMGLTVEEGTIIGYSRLKYTVIMKRHSSMYLVSLVVPILFFFALDLLCHFIPKSYIDKINFKLTVLLGSSVMALVLNDYLPASPDNPPIIVIFFVGTTTLMILGILEIVFVMYIGGKILKPDAPCVKKCSFYHELFNKSCLTEVQTEAEEKELGDAGSNILEMMYRDVQQMRRHIWSLQKKEALDNEREVALERLEMWLYYFHVMVVAAFYTICKREHLLHS